MPTEPADIVDPVVLIRIPRAFRPGMSELALYEATRGVWRIGPRRDKAKYALAVYNGIVQEVYAIHQWQAAWTTKYVTRTFENTAITGRSEFVGAVADETVRARYLGKSVAHHFSRGSQNPVSYVGVAK